MDTVAEQYEKYRERLMNWHGQIYDVLPNEYRTMGLRVLWDISGSIRNAMECEAKEALKHFIRYERGVASLLGLLPREARRKAEDLYVRLSDETVDTLVSELRSRCDCKIDREE